MTRTEPTGDQVIDYYAQDRRGNVWWFGREGVWLAGEDGAEAGLAMPATPRLGDGWRAAYDADVVDVRMTVETLDQVADTPAGRYSDVVGLDITNPLEPGTARRAFYERGVGLVEEISTDGPPTSPSCRARPADSLLLAHSGGRSWVVSVPGSDCGGVRLGRGSGLRRSGLNRLGWRRRLGRSRLGRSGLGRRCGRLPLLQRLPLLSGVVPLPAVLDDRLLLPRGLVLGGLLLVPLLLVLVGRAVAGHRGRRGPRRSSAPSRPPGRCRGRRSAGR